MLLCLLSGLLLFSPLSAATDSHPPAIYLAESDRTAFNQQVWQQLATALEDLPEGTTELRRYQGEDPGQQLVITLGPDRLNEVITQHPDARILALFVSRSHLQQRLPDQPALSAIYSDPPLVRQARLGQLIIPGANRIALLSSPALADNYSPDLEQLKEQGVEVRVFVVSQQDRLIRTLNQALSYGDLLVGTVDNAIYNHNTIKHLLLTSYRRNRILIGPDLPFVRAGAVATSYSNSADQLDAAIELIAKFQQKGELPPPRYPSKFAVSVNYQVARSMDLLVPDEKTLARRLRRMEESADE